MEKVCKQCLEKKSVDFFPKHSQMKDGYLNQCKGCKAEYNKAYQTINKEKLSQRSKEYYEENREKIVERVRTRWNQNANEINEKRRQRYRDDEVYREKRLRECSVSNAKHRPARRRKDRENKTPAYYLELCRKRMWHAFNGREAKSDKTINLLGCDGHFLKEYLESTKDPGKDYSKQHIDHIIPCSSFDLSDETQQRKCFHYTNLQILTREENLAKSNKILIKYLARFRRMKLEKTSTESEIRRGVTLKS